ncbi:unnamed protein product [Caretta caretta]
MVFFMSLLLCSCCRVQLEPAFLQVTQAYTVWCSVSHGFLDYGNYKGSFQRVCYYSLQIYLVEAVSLSNASAAALTNQGT